MKKALITILILAGISGGYYHFDALGAKQTKLKAKKFDIYAARVIDECVEFKGNGECKKSKKVVQYAHKGNLERAKTKKINDKEVKEDISLRTHNSVTYKHNDGEVFTTEFIGNNSYRQEGNDWYVVDVSTSTIEDYEDSTGEKISKSNSVLFDLLGIYEAKATDSNIYSGSDDGYMFSAINTTWSTVYNGTGETVDQVGSNHAVDLIDYTAMGGIRIYRLHGSYDTSSLPDMAIIMSSSLNLYLTSAVAGNLTSHNGWHAVASEMSGGTAAEKWDSFTTAKVSYSDETRMTTSNAYTSVSLNSVGLAAINKTGNTKIGLAQWHDVNNTDPNMPSGNYYSDNFITYFSEYTGTSRDPYLSVTYRESAADLATQSKGLIGHWSLDKSDTTIGTTNLVTNGTMEADANWTNYQTPTVNERSTTQVYAGTYSRKLTSDSANDGIQNAGSTYTTRTGNTYYYELYVYPETATRIRLAIRSGANSAWITDANRTGLTAGQWNKISGTYTETAGGSGAYLLFYDQSGDTGTWYFDAVAVYDTSGNISDLTPSGNTGISILSPNWTTDRHGQSNKAMSFNGTSDYVDLSSHVADYTGLTQGSICARFKTNQNVDTIMSLSKGTTAGSFFELTTYSNSLLFQMHNGSAAVISIQGTTAAQDDAWHHVCITQDGTTSRMYIDATAQADTDSGEWFDDIPDEAYLRIGNIYYSSANIQYFSGSISDVRLYDYALSQAEITSLYNTYKPRIETSSLMKGLIGHWDLASSSLRSSTVISDLTPQSNHGTLTGSQTFTTDRNGQAYQALSLNGSSQYVDLSSHVADYASQTQGTLTFWFKTGAINDYIFGFSKGDTTNFFVIQTQTTGGIRFQISPGYDLVTDNTGYNDNLWHHIVISQNGTKAVMYFDGVLQADTTGSSQWFSTLSDVAYMYIGSLHYGGSAGGSFQGVMSDVRLYNRALSQTEVTSLYNLYLNN
jgi:hypothetical protein